MLKGIIVASFGTTHMDGYEKSFGKVEKELKEKYKDCYVLPSFSSEIVRKRLNDRDIHFFNMPEALKEMEGKGIRDISILSLYIIEGVEYEKVIRQIKSYNNDNRLNIKITRPLFEDEKDVKNVADYLKKEFNNEATVLMGHGTYHKKDMYFNKLTESLINSEKNIVLGTVEGAITINNVINYLNKKDVKNVTLAPFLLVVGDHGKNDMASKEDKDSWYNRLLESGYNIDVDMKGLLERDFIKNLFYEKLEGIL